MIIKNEKDYQTALKALARLTIRQEEQRAPLVDAIKLYDDRYHSDREGDWMPTYSGNRFWPADPRPCDIHLVDIAHSLSLICRWNGHVKHHYSVAQHSIHVCSIVDPKHALYALFHDAAEAYIGDIITPFKNLWGISVRPSEDAIMGAIATAFTFKMTEEAKKAVKEADRILLATEIRDLCPAGVSNFCINGTLPQPLSTVLPRLDPEQAEEEFYRMFDLVIGV